MRKTSNLIALSSLLFFVVVIVFVGSFRWAAIQNTKEKMDELSEKVAELDKDRLMNWASGHEKDNWGNTFILEKNLYEVQFRSKGPDGISGTKDDIFSDSFPRKEPQYNYKIVIEKKPLKSIISSVYDKYKNWRRNEEK